MAAMTGEDFWLLLQYILPFFVILFPAYGMARKKILTPAHAVGLNRWTSLVGIPIYVGHMVAFNDPYETNLRLVGADALQKVVVLIIACVWWRFSKRASIDGVITFFMLATLSNMVLVGPALFRPLHGTESDVSIATIVLLQCVLWYNLCIALFEVRIVLKEMRGEDESASQVESSSVDENKSTPLPGLPLWYSHHELPIRNHNRPLSRSISLPTRGAVAPPSSHTRIVPTVVQQAAENAVAQNGVSHRHSGAIPSQTQATDVQVLGGMPNKTVEVDETVHSPISEASSISLVSPRKSRADMTEWAYIRLVAFKVVNRVKYAPLMYTSSIGFVYSLFAFKYGWEMPYTLRQAIELVAKGAIAISVVTMALTWYQSGKLVACGYKRMIYGWMIRFVVGPLIMVAASLAFGLRGIAFEFSVLQAALPVGLVSFVLANEYKLDVEVFSTAVITQLVIFLPIVVVYYFMLQVAE